MNIASKRASNKGIIGFLFNTKTKRKERKIQFNVTIPGTPPADEGRGKTGKTIGIGKERTTTTSSINP